MMVTTTTKPLKLDSAQTSIPWVEIKLSSAPFSFLMYFWNCISSLYDWIEPKSLQDVRYCAFHNDTIILYVVAHAYECAFQYDTIIFVCFGTLQNLPFQSCG